MGHGRPRSLFLPLLSPRSIFRGWGPAAAGSLTFSRCAVERGAVHETPRRGQRIVKAMESWITCVALLLHATASLPYEGCCRFSPSCCRNFRFVMWFVLALDVVSFVAQAASLCLDCLVRRKRRCAALVSRGSWTPHVDDALTALRRADKERFRGVCLCWALVVVTACALHRPRGAVVLGGAVVTFALLLGQLVVASGRCAREPLFRQATDVELGVAEDRRRAAGATTNPGDESAAEVLFGHDY